MPKYKLLFVLLTCINLSGCFFLTATGAEEANWFRVILPWLLGLLGIGGAGAAYYKSGNKKQPPPQDSTEKESGENTTEKTILRKAQATQSTLSENKKQHIHQVLEQTIEKYKSELQAYLIVEEAIRIGASLKIIKGLREVYGEKYSIPLFSLPDELLNVTEEYVAAQEYLYSYIEKQGGHAEREKDPKRQIEVIVEKKLSDGIAAELQRFIESQG